RLELLRLLADEPSEPAGLLRGLEGVVRLYRDAWALVPTPRRDNAAPASLARLPVAWRQAFDHAAAPCGWHHPGLLAAFDQALGVLAAPAGRTADRTVTAWVLFAWPEHNDGWLCRLTLERLPDGAGGYYPNPLTNGYTALGDEFQQGLANAW